MKLYDLEHHFYDEAAVEAMTKRKGGYPYYDRDADMVHWTKNLKMPFNFHRELLMDMDEGRLEIMDRVGITTAVLSHSQALEELDPSESIELAKHANDTMYEKTQKYPDRYLASAILPMRDPDAACKELKRCVNDLGFVAWHTHSNYSGESPHAEKFVPVFETAADLGIYVYLHPTLPANSDDYDEFGFTFAGPAAGFTIDTMVVTLKLILSGIFDRVPDLKMVIGHFGEAIPFLLDRIDNRIKYLPNPLCKNQRLPSDYFRDNIYVTTSGNMSPAAFKCTKDVLGIDKIIFGSDYCYENIDAMTDFVKELDITEEEREKLFFKNAEKLLKI